MTTPKVPPSGNERPTILIVGMPDSVHTAGWINMVRGAWARIVLVPAYTQAPSPTLHDWAYVSSRADLLALGKDTVGVFDLDTTDREEGWAEDRKRDYRRVLPVHMTKDWALATAQDVVTAVRLFQPDLIHSLEIQIAGYVVSESQRRLGRSAPPWVVSNWGSDLYLYERLVEHRPVLLEIMRGADGYIAECRRDLVVARELGFRGISFEPTPASGGQNFGGLPSLSELKPPSRRDLILVKGYHGWAGRGLHVLSAIHLAAAVLRKFRIRVLFASPASEAMAAAMAEQDGLDIAPARFVGDHSEALNRLGQARMVLAASVSDGISTTLLEAMSLGVFPIQSDTSCACEWVEHGRDAFIVSPHDVAGLAQAIVTAAQDDSLVDQAAARNRVVVEQRWDRTINAARAQRHYRIMLGVQNPQSPETAT